MFASRLTITRGDPSRLAHELESFTTVSLPVLRSCRGFRKVYLLANDEGTIIAMSIWETDDDMRASEEAVQRLRERFDPLKGPGAPVVERFRVLVDADPK